MIQVNEGTVDRVIRVAVGVLLLVVSFLALSGILQIVGYIAGGALLITGAVGFCGLYALFGVSTCPNPKK
jgi:hypothetical protein